MKLTIKQIKQRHFDKVYQGAKIIKCACGCGKEIKNKDKYGRDKKYISGHNTPKKYDDPKQFKREWAKRNKFHSTEYRKNKRHERKGILIEYRGGRCRECGVEYNGKNGCIFDFHHIKGKDFGVSGNVMEKSMDKLKKEVDRCLLLCSNCHRPKHSNKY